MNSIARIHLWSGPRNISTAMMYSFAQRADTRVVDEPLYAHYLRVSGAPHPGREDVLASQENDGVRVIDWMLGHEFGKPVVFFKQMTHHLVGLPEAGLRRLLAPSGPGRSRTKNIILIRDPRRVLHSYAKVVERPTLPDIGIRQCRDLFDRLKDQGCDCIVLDSTEVLRDPKAALANLCAALDLPFDEAMLRWPAGARPEDGVWARHWYANVHRSTGFGRPEPGPPVLRGDLAQIEAEARPYYDFLRKHSLTAE